MTYDLSGSYVHVDHGHSPRTASNGQPCSTVQRAADQRVERVKEQRLARVPTATIDSALAGRAKKEKNFSVRNAAVTAATGASILLVLYAIKKIANEFVGHVGSLN